MKLASKFKTATVLGAVCAAFAVPAHAEFTGSPVSAFTSGTAATATRTPRSRPPRP